MKKLILLLFIPLVLACSSDSADEVNEPCPSQPEISTNEVTNINYDQNNDYFTATLSGEISNIPLGPNCETLSVTNQGFVYDTNIQPTVQDNVANANGQNASTNITGLIPETTYYVRAYLTNTLGTFYGNQVVFETSETPDLVAPIITIIGDNPMRITQYYANLDQWLDYEELGATAVDDVDGDITDAIEISSNVDAQVEGTYEVIYSVSDSWGNTATETRIVEVYGSPVYLAENGITVKAHDWAIADVDFGYINGIEYRIVSTSLLGQWISAYNPTYRVCTSRVSGFLDYFWNVEWQYWNWSERNINDWDVSNVYNMSYVFYGANGNSTSIGDLGAWDTSNVTDMSYMFYDYGAAENIGNWDVSNVTNMSNMFYLSSGVGDISSWDVSNVTNMSHMFGYCGVGDISSWNVSNVTDMSFMFTYANTNDIVDWDVSSVINMNNMFSGAQNFNQNLSNWDVGNVTECYNFCLSTFNWTLPKPNFTNCSDNIGCD